LLLFPDGVPGLTQAAGGLVDLLDVLTRWFAAWPGASLVVYGPTPGMTLCYYGALVGAYLAAGGAGGAGRLRIRQAVCGSLAGLSALLCAGQILLRLFPLAAPEAVRLTMLDVGQGEAMFLELPGRTRILVDAGGRFGESSDMGRRVVVPFLWHAWIGRLDALVVSHAETDHAQGVAGVLDLMPVAEVWTGPPIEGSVTAIWLEELLRQRRIPQRVLAADSPPFRAGGAVVRILHPSAPGVAGDAGARPGAANEASLVLRIELAERAILLTGDIGRDGEAALLAAGRSLRAQLLKVPHHGSRTSSSGAFLAAVDPDSAIVSVGYRNQFRHPHPEVVERIESRSVRLLRTDRDGAIEVEMSGAGLRIRGHREREP
ncbi:MAG: ComEC/Rec2 family competence protein, partial [Candidatus Methylomirabilota bacterium]